MHAIRLLPTLVPFLLIIPPSSVQAVHPANPTPAIATPQETVSAQTSASDRTDRGTDTEKDRLARTGEVLFLFLVLSVVVESAMSVIFDWRIFIRHFEGRGVKTPFIVGTTFLLFLKYDLDIIYDLLVALGRDASPSIVGTFLTALLVAGGSGGIFRIFSRLGIRSPAARRRKAEEERRSDSSTSSD